MHSSGRGNPGQHKETECELLLRKGGCDVFLMSKVKEGHEKRSDKNHLYLYRDDFGGVFYHIKRTVKKLEEIYIIYLDDEQKDKNYVGELAQLLKDEVFEAKAKPRNKLIRCKKPEIINAILKKTVELGDTVREDAFFPSNENHLHLYMDDESKKYFYCIKINGRLEKQYLDLDGYQELFKSAKLEKAFQHIPNYPFIKYDSDYSPRHSKDITKFILDKMTEKGHIPTSIDPCNPKNATLVAQLLRAHPRIGYFSPDGIYTLDGKAYAFTNPLLLRTRAIYGLPDPQIKYDVLSKAPFAKGGFGAVHTVEKVITLGERSMHIKEDGKHVVKLIFENLDSVTFENQEKGFKTTPLASIRSEREKMDLVKRFHPKELQRHETGVMTTHFINTIKFEGMPLYDVYGKTLPLEDYFKLFKLTIALLRALKEQIHDFNLIHFDIKMQNIIVNPDTLEVNIIDLGVSANKNDLDDDTILGGTPVYAPPEQIVAGLGFPVEPSEKSDIYSMGLILAILWGAEDEWAKKDPVEYVNEAVKNAIACTKKVADNAIANDDEDNAIANDDKFNFNLEEFSIKLFAKSSFQGQDLCPDAQMVIKEAITNMVIRNDPSKRKPIDDLINSFHKAYVAQCYPKASEDAQAQGKITEAFQRGIDTRSLLVKASHQLDFIDFMKTLEESLINIMDKSNFIKEFVHGLGVRALKEETTKQGILDKSKKILSSYGDQMKRYHDLIVKSQDLLTKYAITSDPVFRELNEFILELRQKMRRIARRPFDLDLLQEKSETLEAKYDSWNNRLREIKKDPHMMQIREYFGMVRKEAREQVPFSRIFKQKKEPDKIQEKEPDKNQEEKPNKEKELDQDLKDLQNVLRGAIRKYTTDTLTSENFIAKKRAGSDDRRKDMQDFLKIINTSTSEVDLKTKTQQRMSKIQTGWWFNNSKLRDNLEEAIKSHDAKPHKHKK